MKSKNCESPSLKGPFRLVAELATVGDRATFSGVSIELLASELDGDLILLTPN